MIDLDELERLARAATPGPWTYDDSNVFSQPLSETRMDMIRRRLAGEDVPHPDADDEYPLGFICTTTQRTFNCESNERFIAAFSPSTALALIAVAKAAREWREHAERNDFGGYDPLWAALDALETP